MASRITSQVASEVPPQVELIEQAIRSVPGRRQEDLAAAMGVSQQAVSRLARGEMPVSPEHAIAIHIPTTGVESLNAAVACGVILYEAQRQRAAHVPERTLP